MPSYGHYAEHGWVTSTIVPTKEMAVAEARTWRKRGYRAKVVHSNGSYRVMVEEAVSKHPVHRMMGF